MLPRSVASALTTLFCAAGGLVLAGPGPAAALGRADSASEGTPPRLVVLISIDQCRADYIARYNDLYLPPGSGREIGGFRYLRARGAWYPDCRYQHHRTVTGAGHAILGTGAQPGVNGIVGNSWWDRSSGKVMYCTADAKSQVVGALSGSKEKPMSAANLLTTTTGDELELATGGRARTVSISLKDRAAILMSGHRTDTAVWFDEDTGAYVTSTAYAPDGKLPAWVEEFNGRKIPEQMRAEAWKPSVDAEALARVWNPKGKPVAFSHALATKDFNAWATSPSGNAFVFETCKQALTAEKLGQDEVPDLLTINLASNDYVGHKYGPDSAEVLDISVQTDRQLADFFRYLDDKVPGGLKRVTIAVSADHGCASAPEVIASLGAPVERAITSKIAAAAETALDEAVGAADWIASGENGELYFHPKTLAEFSKEPRSRLEQIAADAVRSVRGVYFAIGKTAVLSGQVPRTTLGNQVSVGVNPERSGDVIVFLQPHWLGGSQPVGTGSSHGSPFPYDSQVPLLMAGAGVRPGTYLGRVSPAQVAPSLSHILGVARPGGADEPLLPGLQGSTD